MSRRILFSPPDITQAEIDEVVDALKSGWITTGPKTKKFEEEITKYCGSDKTVCVNSDTAAMEMILRLFDIGPGDEVITSAYTYTASASVIVHCGATPVLVDVKPGEFNINPEKIEEAITERTKVIIPVDIGGMPADYDEIFEIVERKKDMFKPKKGTYQENLGRILVLADAAHSFGAEYKGKKIGSVADFTCYSFHAVKNLTTAEGGAITWRKSPVFDSEKLYKELMLLVLHGQNKDALAKMKAGAWKYDIVSPAFKCNMTDIHAAIGLAQLRRYDSEILAKKDKINEWYKKYLGGIEGIILPEFRTKDKVSSRHIFALRLKDADEKERNRVIQALADKGIATNVHFQPLPLLTAYKNLGFKIEDYPEAYKMYSTEISMPFHGFVEEEDVKYIAECLREVL